MRGFAPALPTTLNAWAPRRWTVAFLPKGNIVAWGWAERVGAWVAVDPHPPVSGAMLLFVPPEEWEAVKTSLAGGAAAYLSRPAGPLASFRIGARATCAAIIAQVIGWQTRALRTDALFEELMDDPLTEAELCPVGTEP